MFVKGIKGGALARHMPPGCNPLDPDDRIPVLKVISGDTWTVSAHATAADGGPASPKNSHVEFVIAENQFSPPIWTGEWINGILPDKDRPGLVRVQIPRRVTKALRRGSYMFSMRVSDPMRHVYDTQLEGNFLVEYLPTSDQHSIPYRDGTSEIFGSASDSVQGGTSQDQSLGEGVFIPDPKTGKYHKLIAVTDPEAGEVNIGVSQEGLVSVRRD